MEILITRHGQTEWNVQGKVQGKADIELNNKGIEQAYKTKDILSTEKIDLIICSPLKRARQTADIINENRNIPIIYDDMITERDFGEFQGLNRNDFDYNEYWSYKADKQYDKAENIKAFFQRVYNFLDKINEQYALSNKRILIVAHGGVGVSVNCYFNGIPVDNNLSKLILENCEVAKYRYSDSNT